MRISTRRFLLLITIGCGALFNLPQAAPIAQQDPAQGGRRSAQDTASLKLKTELVSVQVAVTDQHGHAISGLTKDDFRIYEDKIEQPVSFFSDQDAPASVAVVFDASNSMSNTKIEEAREAVGRFVQTSRSDDEYSLISFNDNARLLLERTHDSDALLADIANVHPEGNTALYDGVALGIETISHSS